MSLLYFGYGSNLHPAYMQRRLGRDFRFRGVGELSFYELAINKIGRDGSGKANIVDATGGTVFGSVYEMGVESFSKLKAQETGYDSVSLMIQVGSELCTVESFVASAASIGDVHPFDWYIKLIVAGAHKVHLPEGYIQRIRRMESVSDPVAERRAKFDSILEELS